MSNQIYTRNQKIKLLQDIEEGKTIEELTATGVTVWVLNEGIYKDYSKAVELSQQEFENYEQQHRYIKNMIVEIVKRLPDDED